ncbi:MAG: CPBP family intramembrane metalloprotease [Lentisphaerae bacterium]|nr:CPBP family intramembrane metalloprotease [Lentisphaerota bacterium]
MMLPNGGGVWRRAERRMRWIEFLALYLLMPVALFYTLPPRGILPVLWVAGLAGWFLLRADPGPDPLPRRLYSRRRELGVILLRFAVVAVLLTAALWLHRPGWLFRFPRSSPRFWLLVMGMYPLISVLPQGVLYRQLFERRYAPLFSSPRASWMIGSLVFGFAHLPFGNLWAVGFPFLGGLLFLRTYRRTGSLALSCIEHGLYGDLLFTIGWGVYLFHGGTQAFLAS